MREDRDLLCTTMTHELGHLLGHSHDSAPGSIMAAALHRLLPRAGDLPGDSAISLRRLRPP